MIDLHCHFLPGVDDGARTLDEAMALVRASCESGVSGAVVTPHVYPGVWDNTEATLLPAFASLKAAIAASGLEFELALGAEVRLHPDSLSGLIQGQIPTLGMLDEHRIALIEFPDGNIPPGALNACKLLVSHRIRPMLAHPERNKDVMRDPMRMRAFVDAGCILQVTAASVIGQFGEPALGAAHHLLAMGLVGVIASDSHNLMHRPPRLAEAREALRHLYGQGVAYRLTEETPAMIMAARSAVPTGQ